MLLAGDSRPVRIDILVTAALLDEAQAMIGDVRAARRYGVTPRVCGCPVCSSARRDEVIGSVTGRKDVSMIHGVGRAYATALEAAGYPTWDALLGCDPDTVARAVTGTGARGCGRAKVADWQLHARALASGLPEFRPGTRWPVTAPYIAVDLEYDVTPGNDHVWLAGAALIHPDGADYYSLWAGTPGEEFGALAGLAARGHYVPCGPGHRNAITSRCDKAVRPTPRWWWRGGRTLLRRGQGQASEGSVKTATRR
jgi:hypothetical protein